MLLLVFAASRYHNGCRTNVRLAWTMSKDASNNTIVNGQLESIHER